MPDLNNIGDAGFRALDENQKWVVFQIACRFAREHKDWSLANAFSISNYVDKAITERKEP